MEPETPESVEPLTDVMFRVDPTNDELIAVFPGLNDSYESPQHVVFYVHVGQHGDASLRGLIRTTRPVRDPARYADLKAELERIGYRLRVVERATRHHQHARYKQWMADRFTVTEG